MKKEAQARIIRPEFGRNQSIVAEAVIHVDFSAGPSRGLTVVNEIVAIGGSFAPRLEIVHSEQKPPSNIVEFPKISQPEITPIEQVEKAAAYNPGKRVKSYIDENGRRLIKIRRKSRCDGVHDAEEKPCGSPRCRTKNRTKMENKQTAGKEKNTKVRLPN